MKKSMFEQMIREIVKQVVSEEIKKQLPQVVSEIYLKRLVSESNGRPKKRTKVVNKSSASPRAMSLEDAFELEISKQKGEHVPSPMSNSDEGIYQKGPIQRKNEQVRSKFVISEGNPFAAMFEGVTPTEARESGVMSMTDFDPPDVYQEPQAPGKIDITRFGEIAARAAGTSKAPIKKSPDAVMRELEEKRRRLDERKVG